MRRHRLMLVILAALFLCACPPMQAAAPNALASLPKDAANKLPAIMDVAGIPIRARVKIDPELLKQLAGQAQEAQIQQAAAVLTNTTPLTCLVQMRDQASLRGLAQTPSLSKRRELLLDRLQDTARRSQTGILAYLENQRRAGQVKRYRSFWIFNGLVVEGTLATIIALAQRPDVAAILPNRAHHLAPLPREAEAPALVTGTEWNISRIGADRAWKSFGVTGEGIVIANMDSGVDWTHPTLQPRYRGYNPANPSASIHDYNWFDATGIYPNAPGPNRPDISSSSDHGTHTMGTIVGGNEGGRTIGVAPGARWIAAKVFDDQGRSTDEWIHAGFQWLLAPTDLHGRNPDPSKSPDIVCNSWGDDDGQDLTFRQDLEALRAAGIFTVWAAGNNGPGSGTVGSPASLDNAFSVGAVNSQDQVAYFSSRGPSPWGVIKPEVAAPGVNIRSSVPGGGYEGGWNGTSMATPHVAGLAALMWQADRFGISPGASADTGIVSVDAAGANVGGSLSITATAYIITSTATDLGPVIGRDNDYGAGLINAYQAVATVIEGGTLAGRVTNAITGAGVADALVTMTSRAANSDDSSHTSTRTDALGYYSLTLAKGRYDVAATKFGYITALATDIQILSRTVTQLDMALQPEPGGIITGQVTRPAPGTLSAPPANATVQVLNTPITTTVDAQGYYTLTLPADTYTIRVLPNEPGYRGAQQAGVSLLPDAYLTLDFTLETAPRLLVVDADAWRPTSYLDLYRAMLDDLLYSYDTWAILAPPVDNPSAPLLAQYDLVIWSQPNTSPGYIGAWRALGAFLEQGGKLLISGQDIGYWDYEQKIAAEEYALYLHANYDKGDGGLSRLLGSQGSALEGVALAYNTADSAQNQLAPDAVIPADGLAASLLQSPSEIGAAVAIEACAYRAAYLGFGLEGVGPTSSRERTLERLIGWLAEEQPIYKPALVLPVAFQMAAIGRPARYALWVTNSGQAVDSYTLSVESFPWSARLVDPQTGQPVDRVGPLDPCGSVKLELQIEIPPTAVPDEQTETVVQIHSTASGANLSRTVRTSAMAAWQSVAPMPTARYRLAAASVDCALLAIGGFGGDDAEMALSTVERLNLASGAWSAAASKPTPAANAAIAQVGGMVYVLGGYNPDSSPQFLNVVEVYDPVRDRWTTAPPLPKPLSGAAAAAWNGSIYLFGGSDAAGESNTTYRYNLQLRVWETRVPVPESGVSFAQAVALDGYIYLAGGWPNQADLWRYDPVADAWLALAPMSVGRHSFVLAAHGSYLVVAGGGAGWDGLGSAERYDPATDTWQQLPSLSSADRVGTVGAWADGSFYTLGGVGQEITASVERLPLDVPLGGSHLAVDLPVARVDDTLHYSLTIRNPANSDVAADWSLALPAQLDYVAGSGTGGLLYDAQRRMLTWAGTVPGASKLPFGFSAIIRPEVASEIPSSGTMITAIVPLNGGGCGPSVLSATTEAFLPSLGPSTKTVDKREVAPGERLHYTISLANGSPFTISNASLVDPIPTHTTLVPASLTGGAVYNPDLNQVEWQGSLPPAEQAPTFHWIDATDGETLALEDDTCAGPLDLGFEFVFYGRRYSQIYVNSNGMVFFDACDTSYDNVPIPNTSQPNNFLAPFWDDLVPGGGMVRWKVLGEAPQRYVVIEWQGVDVFSQNQQQTFEVILYEGSNRVVFQYLNLRGERGKGSSATVGLENADGTKGIQYLYNGCPKSHELSNGLAIDLAHSSAQYQATHLITFDVVVDDPVPPATIITNTARIDDGRFVHERSASSVVYTPSFAQSRKEVQPAQALSGEVVTYTLHIVNSGNAPAVQARLKDPLPAELTLVPGSLQGNNATYDEATHTIQWQGALPPDAAPLLISYQARVADGLPVNTPITNTATLSEQGISVMRLQANLLVNEINLEASTKMAHTSQALAGDPITYTITLRNTGRVTAENALLTDALPAQLTFVKDSLEGGTYDDAQRAVTWQGALPAGGERVIRFQANTSPNATNGTDIVNVARLEDGYGHRLERSAQVEIMRGDLSGSDMVVAPAQVSPEEGGTVVYTLRLRNNGPVDLSGTLYCLPPEPLAMVPASLYASTGNVRWNGELSWEGTVRAQGLALVRFSATISPHLPEQTITTEARLIDSGGLETVLQADLVIGNPLSRDSYLPLVYR